MVSVTSFVLGIGEEVDTSELVVMSLVTLVVISVVISVVMSLVTPVVISVVTSGLLVGFKVVMSELVIASVLVEGGEEVVISESVTMSMIQEEIFG